MKAIILIGGRATRLEPLTINTPKSLIPVLNVPFIEYVIRNLAQYGIQDIVLAMGHLSHLIKNKLGDGKRFDVELHYSIEDTPLGSAGAAKKAEKYLDETFLVINGDNFIDLDFREMYNLHRENRAKVTIALTHVTDPTRYGLVETDKNNRVRRFLEKPKPEEVTTNTVNAGAWLVEPDVMALVPPEIPYSYERNVFPELLERGEPVYAYTSSGYWMDAGTPDQYLQLHRDLLNGKSRQYTPSKEPVIGTNTVIHSTAEIKGHVIIGSYCSIGQSVRITGPAVIGDGCIILNDSIIENSVIWSNVRLGPGACILHSIVADECCLNSDCSIENSVLADKVTLTNNTRLEPGSKIRPGTVIE